MFRKLFIVSAISSSAFISPMAMADTSDSGLYLTAGIGKGLEYDVDGTIDGTAYSATGSTTFAGGLGLGYDFPENNWRVEAGVSRATTDVDSVTLSGTKYEVNENETSTALSVAIAYDFENDSKITPFVEGSISRGWADDVDASTSYGIGVGLSTPVSDGMELWGSVGVGISEETTDDVNGYSVKADSATAWGFSTGLRIRL